ncbi:MAG: ABC transporter substrate-binding protein [Thermomicrobiales bacterium]
MRDLDVSELVRSLQDGQLSRRAFVRRVTAMGLSASAALILARSALAQTATPVSTTPASDTTHSITREEYLAAVRREFPFEQPAARGGHVLMAIGGDVQTLNPIVAVDGFSGMVNGSIFSTIVLPSAIDGSWAPDLADYWEVSADGMVYTFHLNPNAAWHDGVPLTAHDCVFTLDAVLDESGLSAVRSNVVNIVKSYRAADDHTFELVALKPTAILLDKSVGLMAIVPKHIWESIPFAEWGAAPGATGSDPSMVVGSGPFRFGEWVRGDHVSVVRNDNYWIPELVPTIDTFTYRVLPDTTATVQSLMVGETDISFVPGGQVEALQESHPEFSYTIYDEMGWIHFEMNGDPDLGAFFVDKRVRQAMLYALDRDLIVEVVMNGFGVRADGIYPPPSHAYAPERVTTIYNHDPDRARSLLDDAGWIEENGIREKDGLPFRTEILYGEAGAFSSQLVTYMQQAWREIGLDIQTAAIPFPTLIERATRGDFELLLIGFVWSNDDMGLLYRCDALPPNGFNAARICDPEFDRLNDESQFELDPDRRRELLIEQSNVANDNAHLGLLYFTKTVYATQPHIQNFFANSYLGVWSLPRLWIEDAE